jgi:hypothetical protein
MPRDKAFNTRSVRTFLDDASCRVGVKSCRLDVVTTTNVSEEGTTGDVGALSVLI